MKTEKYAKNVGTMIGSEGHIHRWTAPRVKFIQRAGKINGTSKSLVERLVDFKICALSVLGHLGSISACDRATLKEVPVMVYLLTTYALDLRAALASIFLVSVSPALPPVFERLQLKQSC